jgi:hypothetical protein
MANISTLIKQIKLSGYGYAISSYSKDSVIIFIHNYERNFYNGKLTCLNLHGKTELDVLSKALDAIKELEVFGGIQFI